MFPECIFRFSSGKADVTSSDGFPVLKSKPTFYRDNLDLCLESEGKLRRIHERGPKKGKPGGQAPEKQPHQRTA